MRRPRPPRVHQARPGSPAERAGIKPGERLLQANGRAPRDYIEYRYLTAEPRVALMVEDGAGRRRRVLIEKRLDEDLGLRFTQDVFDGIRRCTNRCCFCFLAQLPKGLRPTLYLRDDDYRLSFLHGNFVTLTNPTPADRARIARLHLSPLYVSVHATEPQVRKTLFGRPTRDPLAEMKWLTARGIEFHTQIVVCPGVNDGVHLEQTVHDLAALHPGVRSIGVVPVGLTRHRRGLPKLQPLGPGLAEEILGQVRRWQRQLRRRLGSRLVFAADELYLAAGSALPGRRCYEGFWQLGNGIGGARLFLDELNHLPRLDVRGPLAVTLVTGKGAAGLVGLLARKLDMSPNVQAEVCVVSNRLFGSSVTTAGLLAGRDIARALQRSRSGEVVIVPASAIREGEGFLDGMRMEELARQVSVPVLAAGTPREAVRVLEQFDRDRSRT